MAFLSGIAGSLGGVGLGSAIVEVGVNTAALTAGLEKAKAEVAASTSAMSAQTKAVGTGFIIAGAAAVIGMGKAVAATEELAGETKSLQRITGQTAESASSLIFVADKLGVGTASLAQGFGLLAKNISLNAPAIAKYGLEVRDADGTTRDFNLILADAADKYVALGGGLQGAAFAQEIFGRGGKALIPILAQGSEGINEFLAEAERYGVVLSQDTVDSVRQLVIAHRDLDTSLQGLQVSIGVELVPALTAFVHGLTDLVVFAQKVPGPVYVAVGSFVAATGALFLLQKAIALVGATWAPVTGAFAGGTVAAATNAAAVTADTAALKLFIANSSGVVVAEQAVTAATVETTGALTAASAATTGWLAKLALLARGGATGIGGAVPFNVTLDPKATPEQLDTIDFGAQAQPQVEGLTETFNLNAEAAQLAHDKHILYSEALAQVTAGAAGAVGPMGDLAGADADAAAAAADAAAAMQAQKAAQDALAGGIVGLVGDMASVNAAQKTVNDLRRHGNLDTARGRDALIALASATQGYNSDLKTELANIKLVPGHFQAAKDQAAKLGRQMGLTGGELKDFVSGALDAVKSKLDGVKNSADDTRASIQALDGLSAKVDITVIERLIRTGK